MQIHKEVDVRGLNCPLPILRAKKALADMESGQILKVLATDPGSQRDFAAFAKQTGNEIVGLEQRARDDLVRRRRAVQYEPGLVRVVDPSGSATC